MTSRLEGRIRRLEAIQSDDVEEILDDLEEYQSQAILLCLIAVVGGEDGPSDERLRETPMNRVRYEQVLASIPEGTFERLLAAFLERVARKEAAA